MSFGATLLAVQHQENGSAAVSLRLEKGSSLALAVISQTVLVNATGGRITVADLHVGDRLQVAPLAGENARAQGALVPALLIRDLGAAQSEAPPHGGTALA